VIVGDNNDNISTTNNIQNNSSMSPIKKLLIDIKGKGRNEYSFLHPTYSSSSRIPCADFTSFIKGTEKRRERGKRSLMIKKEYDESA